MKIEKMIYSSRPICTIIAVLCKVHFSATKGIMHLVVKTAMYRIFKFNFLGGEMEIDDLVHYILYPIVLFNRNL